MTHHAFAIALWASIAVTIYLLDYVRLPERIGLLNRKPFNCEACLPFWLFAVFLPVAIYSCAPVAILAGGCTAGIITPLLLKLIRK